MAKVSLGEIIASNLRFRNSDIAKVRKYYEDVMQQRNAIQALPEIVVTAPSVHKQAAEARAALKQKQMEEEYNDLMTRISLEDGLIGAYNAMQDRRIRKAENRNIANIITEYDNMPAYNAAINHFYNDPKFIHSRNVEAADKQVRNTAFSDDKTINLILNSLSPSQQIGAIIDGFQGEGYLNSLRNGNSGIFTDTYATRHPYLTSGANLLFDVGSGIGASKLLNGTNVVKAINNIQNFRNNHFFVPIEGSYTRGIGKLGLEDALRTGLIRGNPRGTEVSAKVFAKMFRKDIQHFRGVIKDTGIPGIEQRFFARTLTKKDFDAIKKASKKYGPASSEKPKNTIQAALYYNPDPLENYNTYDDYINAIAEDVANVERMPERIAKGEVQSTLEGNVPVEERFGVNSDYVADGQPLAYYYSDGRNPTRGYDYVDGAYGVRINNPEDYLPFIHMRHLHPSLKLSPKLTDPNVEIFRRGPFGLTLKVNKDKLLKKKTLANKSVGSKISTPLDKFKTIFNLNNITKSDVEKAIKEAEDFELKDVAPRLKRSLEEELLSDKVNWTIEEKSIPKEQLKLIDKLSDFINISTYRKFNNIYGLSYTNDGRIELNTRMIPNYKTLRNTIVHEREHSQRELLKQILNISQFSSRMKTRNIFKKGFTYTNKELRALKRAYDLSSLRNINYIEESAATNREIRFAISKDYGVTGKELDAIIDNMSAEEIFKYSNNLYAYIAKRNFKKFIKRYPHLKDAKTKAMRYALKYVPIAIGAYSTLNNINNK